MSTVAAVPEWVSDGAAWIGLAVGVCALVASFYGFSRWTGRTLTSAVREIVVEELEPVKIEVAGLRDELRVHVEDEAAADVAAQVWRASLEQSVRNIEQAQVPHLGGRASEPDPVKE